MISESVDVSMEGLPNDKAAEPPKEKAAVGSDDPAILESGKIANDTEAETVAVPNENAAHKPTVEDQAGDNDAPKDPAQTEDSKNDKKGGKNWPRRGRREYQRENGRRYRRPNRRPRSSKLEEEMDGEAKAEEVNGTEETGASPKKRVPFNSTCGFCRTTLKEPKFWRSHLCGDKHQSRIYRLLNFEVTKEIKASIDRSIRISGYPIGTPPYELYDYFGSYGLLQNFFSTKERNKPRYCIIEYKEPAALEDVLERTHYWGNRRIEVIKHKKLYNGDYSLELEDIAKKIEELESFSEQGKALVSELELSEKETKMRTDLADIIQEKFRTMYPGCTAEPFGSSVNSLGIHECDLDIFMDLGMDDWSKVRPVYSEKKNEESPPTVPLPTQRDRVRLGTRLLRSMRNIGSVIPIPSARVPILKCRYTPNNLFCDVSFRNPMSVCNTKLIYELASLDPRIRELMMIIRYWDAQFGISSKGRFLEMTKYALTMLVVFMMQNLTPRLLPSIRELQNTTPKMIEGWNVGFSVDFDASGNSMSLKELALNFFTFYSEYDFKNSIICPYLGKSVPKDAFVSAENEMKEFELYSENLKNSVCNKLELDTPMCVQDPFELSLNITRQMSAKALELLQKSCKEATQLITSAENEKGLLLKIVTPSPEALKEREMQKRKYRETPMQLVLRLPRECEEEVIVDAVKHVLSEVMLFEIGPVTEKHRIRKAKLAKSENGRKTETAADTEPEAATKQLSEAEPDSPTENNSESSPEAASDAAGPVDILDPKQVSFACSNMKVTWEGRVGALKRLEIPIDRIKLETERKVTDYVVENAKRRPLRSPVEFICSVHKEEEQRTSISFTNVSFRNLAFRRLRTVLRKLLPYLVEERIEQLQS